MKKILAVLGLLALVVGGFFIYKIYLEPLPDGLDLATTRTTAEGHFIVAIEPESPDYQRNTLHAWIATITTPDGTPVEGASIAIDGGMPQHGHGLPTSPQMTDDLGAGRYKIDGVRFHMRGWWEFKLAITAGDMSDNITFNLVMN